MRPRKINFLGQKHSFKNDVEKRDLFDSMDLLFEQLKLPRVPFRSPLAKPDPTYSSRLQGAASEN